VIPSNERIVRSLFTRNASKANKKLSRKSLRKRKVFDGMEVQM
jgi:hypothetical protein